LSIVILEEEFECIYITYVYVYFIFTLGYISNECTYSGCILHQALLRPRVEEDVRWLDDPAVSSADAIAAVASHYYASQSDGDPQPHTGDQDPSDASHPSSSASSTHGGKPSSSTIAYDARLGLAIEAIPGGGRFDMDMLWRVV
jgi:hypothetical protein